MEKKEDRRVKYTKMRLRDALVALMQAQHISKISVKALCEAADVNRSTFYTHYADQYDLLRQVTAEALGNVISYLDDQDYDLHNPLSVQRLDRILQYAKEHADLFKALLSKNSEVPIQQELIEFISTASFPIVQNEHVGANANAYIRLFAISSCISVLNKWLQDGMQEPTHSLSEFLTRVLYRGIGSF
jgi:AcrR family transcriptional regulator